MNVTDDLAKVAMLIGEPVRAVMLWNLLGGESRPASELAFCANISAQNASAHLARLVEAGLLTVTPQGRHRYYRIATPEVAHAIEAVAALAPSAKIADSLPRGQTGQTGQTPDLRYARTCYDHLAGRVAVELRQALENQGILAIEDRKFTVTGKGERWFCRLGIVIDDLRGLRRPLARQCLDWSERQPHLAGALGSALLEQMLCRGWIARVRATRLVRITADGRSALRSLLNLNI